MRQDHFSAVVLSITLLAGPARASLLLDTGAASLTTAVTASTEEHFTCNGHGCNQDYELYEQGASRFTLANGGLVDSIAYAGGLGDGMTVEIYRSGPGKLIKAPGNLVWRSGAAGQTASVSLGAALVGHHMTDIYQTTNSGLAIAMAPGTYWITLWTPQPTFGYRLALMAGNGLSRNAASYGRYANPTGWGYVVGPQAALQISASGLYPGAVPEPASWALMLAGFGLVGAVKRRYRTLQTAG
ncbi:MAG: hypothetical protein RL490_1309 [Pseudomonadota bacterium]|jgi:hypothetical protein